MMWIAITAFVTFIIGLFLGFSIGFSKGKLEILEQDND